MNKECNDLKVNELLGGLLQVLIQSLLETELANHLNYNKYEHSESKKNDGNMRNGHCKTKKVITKYGNIEIRTPRDRNATFAPRIISKGQTSLKGGEEEFISLYVKGVETGYIEEILKGIYGNIDKNEMDRLVSTIIRETAKWNKRKLKLEYTSIYIKPLQTENKTLYIVLGIDIKDREDILGIYDDNCDSVIEDLKKRGVKGNLNELYD